MRRRAPGGDRRREAALTSTTPSGGSPDEIPSVRADLARGMGVAPAVQCGVAWEARGGGERRGRPADGEAAPAPRPAADPPLRVAEPRPSFAALPAVRER